MATEPTITIDLVKLIHKTVTQIPTDAGLIHLLNFLHDAQQTEKKHTVVIVRLADVVITDAR